MKKSKLYYGAKIKCGECGTEIQSRHVHDYVACKCPEEKNPNRQKGIFIDGGAEYCRMGAHNGTKYEILDGGNYRIGDRGL